MALDELQIEYDKKVFSLAEAKTKVHELQNAKAVQLNENLGEVRPSWYSIATASMLTRAAAC